MNEENKFTFTVNNIQSKKNHMVDGMIALKKIQHYSYALTDEIGLGYSSHVYKGKNDKTNQVVAIKVIDITKQDDLHKQFTHDEISTLQKIKTIKAEHLLKLQGTYKTKNNLYIITQFCQGKDVAKIMRKKKIFTQPQAQGIMKQFLKGYKELYQLKVVHRDLKLANIFVRQGKAILADFGFSIHSDKCQDKFDYNVGSPFYMPPQSLRFNRYSFKSDIWAIGVIAYQLIYGERPWKDRDDDILFDKITTTRIDDLFNSGVSVTQTYKSFIRECLRIDYDRRATPQFVINHEWNLAVDYIDGCQDPPAQGMLKMPPKMQPLSAKNVTYRPIQFQEIQRQKLSQKGSSHQIPYSLMRREPSPHGQINRKNSGNDHIIQNQQNFYIKHQRKASTEGFYGQVVSEIQTEKTILSQIHYCRFLNQVYDQVIASGLDMIKQIAAKIANQIVEIIQFLSKLEFQQENQPILGLRRYINSTKWNKMSQLIRDYQSKYMSKYMNLRNKQLQPLSSQSIVNPIMNLKNQTNQHQRLLQSLTYLYQILIMSVNRSLLQFSRDSKIDYLAEPRNWSSNPQRLLRKLTCMGF